MSVTRYARPRVRARGRSPRSPDDSDKRTRRGSGGKGLRGNYGDCIRGEPPRWGDGRCRTATPSMGDGDGRGRPRGDDVQRGARRRRWSLPGGAEGKEASSSLRLPLGRLPSLRFAPPSRRARGGRVRRMRQRTTRRAVCPLRGSRRRWEFADADGSIDARGVIPLPLLAVAPRERAPSSLPARTSPHGDPMRREILPNPI